MTALPSPKHHVTASHCLSHLLTSPERIQPLEQGQPEQGQHHQSAETVPAGAVALAVADTSAAALQVYEGGMTVAHAQ